MGNGSRSAFGNETGRRYAWVRDNQNLESCMIEEVSAYSLFVEDHCEDVRLTLWKLCCKTLFLCTLPLCFSQR